MAVKAEGLLVTFLAIITGFASHDPMTAYPVGVMVKGYTFAFVAVHIFHVEEDPEASFLRAGSTGVEIHELVAPLPGETTIQKSEPNSFLGTTLLEHLRGLGINELVITGMMSSMCVDSTTRAAAELGFTNIVIHDACAAPDLTLGETVVPGATVHAAFMAAFEGSFAHVVGVEDFLAGETLTSGA